PDGTGDVGVLRSRIATVAAAGVANVLDGGSAPPSRTSVQNPRPEPPSRTSVQNPVLTGIDVLARDGFKQLRGKKIGLITNHTSRSKDGRSQIAVLHTAPGVTV